MYNKTFRIYSTYFIYTKLILFTLDINNAVRDLLAFALSKSNEELTVYCTGEFALDYEASKETTNNFEMIDGAVIPVSIIILGVSIQSYRHMVLVFINLVCCLLLSFAVLIPGIYIYI